MPAAPAPALGLPAAPSPALGLPAAPSPALGLPLATAPALGLPVAFLGPPAPVLGPPAAPAPSTGPPAAPAPSTGPPAAPAIRAFAVDDADRARGSVPLMLRDVRRMSVSQVLGFFHDQSRGELAREFTGVARSKVQAWRTAARMCCAGLDIHNPPNFLKARCQAIMQGFLGPRCCPDEYWLVMNEPTVAYWIVGAAMTVHLGVLVTPIRARSCFERPGHQRIDLSEYGKGLLARCGVGWPPRPGFARELLALDALPQPAAPRADRGRAWPRVPERIPVAAAPAPPGAAGPVGDSASRLPFGMRDARGEAPAPSGVLGGGNSAFRPYGGAQPERDARGEAPAPAGIMGGGNSAFRPYGGPAPTQPERDARGKAPASGGPEGAHEGAGKRARCSDAYAEAVAGGAGPSSF